tara:strand:- start:633 stop:1058 length:426 start_codon:yes stop_codon:yes gene_type:complete
MKTRQCKKCYKTLPHSVNYFQKTGQYNSNGEPYIRSMCKNCFSKYSTEQTNNYRRDNRKKLNAYKSEASCGCGYSKKSKNFSTRSLTFHHEHNNKVANISNMMNHSWKKILEEINKCIIICFNCHMAIHHRENKLLDSNLY